MRDDAGEDICTAPPMTFPPSFHDVYLMPCVDKDKAEFLRFEGVLYK